MIQFFSKRINGKKGFTLVELLVVIAILGLLALIAIPRLGIYRKDAAEAANKASAASIYNGAQAFLAKHGNLEGFDWHDFITGAMPSDAVVGPVTEDGLGGINPVTVSTNDGAWVGIFPDGEGGGGPVTPTTPTITRVDPATAPVGSLLVYVAVHRVATSSSVNATLANWTTRVVSTYYTSTSDRRTIAIFTRIKDGTAADTPGTIAWTNTDPSVVIATITQAFTGAGTYTYVGSGTGANGTSGGTTITITGSATKGQLVFAAAGYRDIRAVSSITQLDGLTAFQYSTTISGAAAWAQAGDAGITNPVVNSASGMGVAAMVVFTVEE